MALKRCTLWKIWILTDLPIAHSENTKKDPSLLNDTPFGNWRFLIRTVVSFMVGLYFRSLPLSSAEKTNCKKFLMNKLLGQTAKLNTILSTMQTEKTTDNSVSGQN